MGRGDDEIMVFGKGGRGAGVRYTAWLGAGVPVVVRGGFGAVSVAVLRGLR